MRIEEDIVMWIVFILIAQDYFKLPRHTIRENANFICLFPQDLKNINNILAYNDHVGADDIDCIEHKGSMSIR